LSTIAPEFYPESARLESHSAQSYPDLIFRFRVPPGAYQDSFYHTTTAFFQNLFHSKPLLILLSSLGVFQVLPTCRKIKPQFMPVA
jgi:hypothetical protein